MTFISAKGLYLLSSLPPCSRKILNSFSIFEICYSAVTHTHLQTGGMDCSDWKKAARFVSACTFGDLEAVKSCLGHGYGVEGAYRGHTPLTAAVANYHTHVVKILVLEGHADVNRYNKMLIWSQWTAYGRN